jgi:YegS/Rv2252/BmrU family lipid kinase
VTKKQRSVFLIANPNAGRGGNRRALAIKSFCEALSRSGLRVEAEATAEPGDAARLAKRAVLEGWREIIVAGGDGTLNEALQGLAGSAARLGVWPNGTANVLARELNLPFKAERIAEMIARGNSRTISYGCARDEISGMHRYFFLMAGIGLDASVVRGTSLELKRRAGVTAFWYSGLQHLKSWQPIFFDVEINGQTYEATFAAIGKAAHYGGNLAITPRARLDEAQFEICLVDSDSRLRYLHLLSHALRSGGINEHLPQVRFFNAPRVRATGSALVQVDGELIGALPMSFEIAAQRIEIIVP